MPNSSDTDYKAIFSHPEMVADIITGFAPGPWLSDIDFSTLEPFKSSFVSDADEADERHSDLIWRVRCKGTWLYVYLLFEFQSTINQFMAIRMLVYLAKVLKWPNTAKHQALSTAIAKLATRVLRKKLPNTPDAPDSINDLKGVVSMLAENIENMILESKKEALKEGRKEGLQEGIKEGLKEGLKEGMKQGGAMMLKAMLASRFGPVPGWASAKIDAATADELAQWGTHLLDASSMEEIFKP
jgi:predicted transposase YdaD